MEAIKKSVGNNGENLISDVSLVQSLLNRCFRHLTPLLPLVVDGGCGPLTIGMIIEFQVRVCGFRRPDGLVDPGQATMKKLVETAAKRDRLSSKPSAPFSKLLLLAQLATQDQGKKHFARGVVKSLTEADYKAAATLASIDVAAIKAVASVESAGGGFLENGKPKILFEGHWFSKLTKGSYDQKHPTISYSKWTKVHYLGGAEEYTRYNKAVALDKQAAMKATSWGKFQIMGFNYKKVGYSTVEEFVKDMYISEGKQLKAFVQFLKSTGLDIYLKSKDWARFAEGYNGPGYAKNKYDIRMKQAYEAFSIKSSAGAN